MLAMIIDVWLVGGSVSSSVAHLQVGIIVLELIQQLVMHTG